MTGLFLNYFRVELTSPIVTIYSLPYDTNRFRELIERYGSNYFFYRENNHIYYWPISDVDDNQCPGGYPIDIVLADHPKIASKIIEEGMIRNFFKKRALKVFRNRHSNSWEIVSNNDLLKSQIPGLVVQAKINFSTFFINANKLTLGFSLSRSIKNTFIWSRDDFSRNKIEHRDLPGRDDYIYANRKSLKRFLDATGKGPLYDSILSKETSPSQDYQKIIDVFKWINKNRHTIFLTRGLSIRSMVMSNLPYEKIKAEQFRSPQRYHYLEQIGTGRFDQRLRQHRPYSYEAFQRQIKVGVICPKEHEGSLEIFIRKLQQTLKTVFHLNNTEFNLVLIENSVQGYKDGCYNSTVLASELVLVVVEEQHRALVPQASPYFICKAKLLGRGIPTQEVQIKNVKFSNEHTLNNISLNIYAKLGGTPWTIEKEEKIKEELIIGVGSTTDANGRPVLGIAQIFHSNGRYLVGNCVPLSNFENYSERLEDFLIKSLKQIMNDHIIDIGQEFRLIFHLFKSASSKYEIKAINSVVSQFSQYPFQYALLHIGYGHNFHIFSDEGKSLNKAGMYIELTKNLALINFVSKGTKPLQVRLDMRSVLDKNLQFNDLYYMSKQIYWFSHLSYKSFTPAKRPVTLSYPALMAKLTDNLKAVDGWDYENLERIGDKLWFI